MKIGIIGAAGCVGSSIAFNIVTQKLADSIVIADIRRNWLEHHFIDLLDAAAAANIDIDIKMGLNQELADADLVIIAAGIPVKPKIEGAEGGVQTRSDLLKDNLGIVREWIPVLNKYCPDAIVIMVTNPIEPLNYAAYLLSERKVASRFIGYSLNDTVRFREGISQVLGVAPSRVEGLAMGEHSEGMVLIFSSVKVDGQTVIFDENTMKRIQAMTAGYLPRVKVLGVPRTSGWMTGRGVSRLVRAIVQDTGEILPCCAIVNGYYGYDAVSLGVPALIGRSGIKRIIELKITPEEKKLFDESVKKIKSRQDSLNIA